MICLDAGWDQYSHLQEARSDFTKIRVKMDPIRPDFTRNFSNFTVNLADFLINLHRFYLVLPNDAILAYFYCMIIPLLVAWSVATGKIYTVWHDWL